MKILRVEDLKNDDIVDRIKKELSSHVAFTKVETFPIAEKVVTKDVIISKIQKNPKVESKCPLKSTEGKRGPLRKAYNQERRIRFLNMKPSDLPKGSKKTYKCELDLEQCAKPVDTLRCANCCLLYKREDHLIHSQECKVKKPRSKFGCTNCSFTDYSIKELENHIKNVHRK